MKIRLEDLRGIQAKPRTINHPPCAGCHQPIHTWGSSEADQSGWLHRPADLTHPAESWHMTCWNRKSP